MRNLFLILCFCVAANCYGKGNQVNVTVSNSLDFDRTNETVEIPWSKISDRLTTATPQNVVVLDANMIQIPSQVIYAGETEPQQLIFQATVKAKDRSSYTVSCGKRDDFRNQAFGRYVPERLDDYAWENNMIAFRLYGPALKDPVSPGIDVWVKCTPELIIDKWYKTGDYHHNIGEGMDCYKVGKTLGGGASAPIVDGKLCLSANYATQQRLDNGPIRTTVKLTYAPFNVAGTSVGLIKIISLDANTPFSKMTNYYSGAFSKLPVAAGAVIHTPKDKTLGQNYIAITESASDSKNPKNDGDISLAAIVPQAAYVAETDGHLVVVGIAKNQKPFTYWSGAGWSGSWVKDASEWNAYVERASQAIGSPLKISIK